MAVKSQILAVGDYVRLTARDGNQHTTYQAGAGEVATYREPVDGLILSIRDIHTGELVTKTEGDLDQYVVELIYNRTFNPRYASLRNAPRGVEDATATSGWKRLRATLRKSAEEGKLYSSAVPGLFTDSPLAALVDGWKIVKIWSKDIENLEKPEAGEAAAE
jgi:hypothetical protein